jgi:hypothetical protein
VFWKWELRPSSRKPTEIRSFEVQRYHGMDHSSGKVGKLLLRIGKAEG